jgi:hypothetical protein
VRDSLQQFSRAAAIQAIADVEIITRGLMGLMNEESIEDRFASALRTQRRAMLVSVSLLIATMVINRTPLDTQPFFRYLGMLLFFLAIVFVPLVIGLTINVMKLQRERDGSIW